MYAYLPLFSSSSCFLIDFITATAILWRAKSLYISHSFFVIRKERASTTPAAVLLDQLVTIDYNARQWSYVETVGNDFLDELLKKVVVVFQNNNN